MKIVCDFLPREYKAVRRNLKLVFAAIVTWALTVLIIAYKGWSYSGQLKQVTTKLANQETTISLLEGQINAVKYPQDKIKELIEKFRFIQQAMGSVDYPFLEFFQALERAVPVNEDSGLRRIAIKQLKRATGATWQLSGVATHWDDILRFEDNLNESIFEKPVDGSSTQRIKKKNFRAIRVFKVDTTDRQVTFEMEFEFNQS